jgi:fibronectin-binding autotransporter adhesin
VAAGTLIVGPSASVASSRSFNVAAGGVLDVTQQAGGLALSTGQTLAGSGLLAGAVTVGSTAVVSPGSGPGTLTVSQDLALGGGGNYNWQMLDAAGAAGSGWDLISSASLTLSALTSVDPFNVNLWSLASTGPDVNGNAANFDASAPGSWRILTSGAAITGFDATHFRVNTLPTAGAGGFSNPLLGGTFSVGLSGDGLGIDLLFAPATPYTWYGNGTTAGGSGTWSPAGLTWNDGSTVVAWDPTRTARFDATAGTVTVSGTVTAANGLNFVTDGYTVTGDTLALTAANRATNAVNVAAGATVTFAGPLTADNGFSKTGSGRMLVTGDVSAVGGASVTSGTLAIGAGGTAGSLTGDTSIAPTPSPMRAASPATAPCGCRAPAC